MEDFVVYFDPALLRADGTRAEVPITNADLPLEYEYSDDENDDEATFISNSSLSVAEDDIKTSPKATSGRAPVLPLSPQRKLIIDEFESPSTSSENDAYISFKRPITPSRTPPKNPPLSTIEDEANFSPETASSEKSSSLLQTFTSSLWSTTAAPDKDSTNTKAATNLHSEAKVEKIKLQDELQKGNIQFTIEKCLMEDWLYKLGSGKDMFRSKSWKARWCRLVLANVEHEEYQDIPVPLLLVSWHSSVSKPSTILVLEQKNASAVNAAPLVNGQILGQCNDSDPTYQYRFDIAFNEKVDEDDSSGSSDVRTFAVKTSEQRDDWVYELNDVIFHYDAKREERQKRILTSKNYLPLPPTIPRRFSSSNIHKISDSKKPFGINEGRNIGLRQESLLEGLDLVQ
ncbi:hypothetical protein CTEN210_04884 [Chaetoceros tenuissimus]|uniref:PH domain-containing protein n=1 Tax=Chaetoceros tenuissimus TaxID=426638 RepID=A0AAD3H370_9STRA|nr:hypothetical protein CTEN210_04884 [Chaetoceros tenuissimus]